jgi:hypothetical protein
VETQENTIKAPQKPFKGLQNSPTWFQNQEMGLGHGIGQEKIRKVQVGLQKSPDH